MSKVRANDTVKHEHTYYTTFHMWNVIISWLIIHTSWK